MASLDEKFERFGARPRTCKVCLLPPDFLAWIDGELRRNRATMSRLAEFLRTEGQKITDDQVKNHRRRGHHINAESGLGEDKDRIGG